MYHQLPNHDALEKVLLYNRITRYTIYYIYVIKKMNNFYFGASMLYVFGGLRLRIPLSLKAMDKLLDRTLSQTYMSKNDD